MTKRKQTARHKQVNIRANEDDLKNIETIRAKLKRNQAGLEFGDSQVIRHALAETAAADQMEKSA